MSANNDRRKSDRRRTIRSSILSEWTTARATAIENMIITHRDSLEDLDHGSLAWHRQDAFADGLQVALNMMTGRSGS